MIGKYSYSSEVGKNIFKEQSVFSISDESYFEYTKTEI